MFMPDKEKDLGTCKGQTSITVFAKVWMCREGLMKGSIAARNVAACLITCFDVVQIKSFGHEDPGVPMTSLFFGLHMTFCQISCG